MSNINYNEWFNRYHRYLTGERDGIQTYNDTKWVTMNKRIQTLIDLNSELLETQPFGVVGNYTGFQKLTELMERSNYTFSDLDRSLIETYRMSLKNAMSSMVVNTHAVIAKYSSTDKRNVSHGKYDHYYIIDVPFAQLHFGDRDEFIRQRLHEFHETENDYYMTSDRFFSSEIASVLGFTFICCTNGFMSDDWKVAIDEKGFRFKIGWKYSADVNFIIYKLDRSHVIDAIIDTSLLLGIKGTYTISSSVLGIANRPELIGSRCIVQISDNVTRKDIQISPNFGLIVSGGLYLTQLQEKTIADFERYSSKKARVRIYIIKYLHEIPSIFPAMNYYDMIGAPYVFDDMGHRVTNPDGSYIRGQDASERIGEMTICTPPITLEYDSSTSFETIITCYNLRQEMLGLQDNVATIASAINRPANVFSSQYVTELQRRIQSITNTLKGYYVSYMKGAIVTSLIPTDSVKRFEEIVNQFTELGKSNQYKAFQSKSFDELYEKNFTTFVNEVTKPFTKEPFTSIGEVAQYATHYFDDDGKNRVNRPISEQCFITLKYNYDENCWVFDAPEISHFRGVSNAFYISDDLKGNELYKFFYLYTDTENPAEKNTESLTYEQRIDFDKFTQEVDKHLGYVKYWNVESRLMKLSYMLHQNHNPESIVDVLSKMLQQKIDNTLLFESPSEINYEMSNVSSDNVGAGEFEIRAPFALNFLFYTVSMLYENKDQLQAYFIHMLTKKEFHPRYADLNVSDLHPNLEKETINYSVINKAPSSFTVADKTQSSLEDDGVAKIFNGLPFPLTPTQTVGINADTSTGTTGITRYPYVFNQYSDETKHLQLMKDGLDRDHYIQYADIENSGRTIMTFYDDARVANIFTHYLTDMYGYINQLQTNYKTHWNQLTVLSSMGASIIKHQKMLEDYITSRGEELQFHHPNTQTIIDTHFKGSYKENVLYNQMLEIETLTNQIRMIYLPKEQFELSRFSGGWYSFGVEINKVLPAIERVYRTVGIDHDKRHYIQELYYELKKYNEPMSLHQYYKWIINIEKFLRYDYETMLSDNETLTEVPSDVRPSTYAKMIDSQLEMLSKKMVSTVKDVIPVLKQKLESFGVSNLSEIAEYCDDVVKNYIFDMYVIEKIDAHYSVEVDSGIPAYVEILIPMNDPHVIPPFEQSDNLPNNKHYSILCQPIFEIQDDTVHIFDLIPVCEYVFFSGEMQSVDYNESTTTSVLSRIYDKNMNRINHTSDATITFRKVSTSSDIMKSFERYIGCQVIPLEVQNVHETFDVLDDGSIVNEKHASMNYELLTSNRFAPLNHTSEFTRTTVDELSGPIDKLYLSCDRLNRLSINELSGEPTQTMFFKPSQILHLNPDNGVITSVGGKYFEGQTIYAVTDDGLSVFPMIVTAVDHNQAHGFVEAKVDEHHASWFQTSDTDVMTKYLTTEIECTVVDDNIRNFLDEFSEYEGDFYTIPHLSNTAFNDYDNADVYTLPGDPIYVTNNSEYVYTRLNWLFHDEIPDRMNGDINPMHHFVYMGSASVGKVDSNSIHLDLIRHDFNPFTDPELYPILRTEPNDHYVWKKERDTINQEIAKANVKISSYANQLVSLSEGILLAKTRTEKRALQADQMNAHLKHQYWMDYIKRLEYYLEQLETPTTWYNVNSYEAAMLYINNGRARLSKTFTLKKRDVVYGQDVEVRLYDWENKCWLDPAVYQISAINMRSGSELDTYDDYTTDDVMTSITITILDQTYSSKRLLIYFVYNESDICGDIEMHEPTCKAIFKPILSLKKPEETPFDVYQNIRIRKHYDENEVYHTQNLKPVPDPFPFKNGFMFERPNRSGLYTFGSPIRFCDMIVKSGNQTYPYTDFDIYVRNPMRDTFLPQTHYETTYSVMTIQPIDGFSPGYHVTLICIQNSGGHSFNGVMSSLMFEAITSQDNGFDILTVQNTTLSSGERNGTFLCTVIPNDTHPMSGGLVQITVETGAVDSDSGSSNTNWFRLQDLKDVEYDAVAYKIIPKEVILVPKDGIEISDDITVQLRNRYVLDSDHDVNVLNTNIEDPFTYYYDKSRDVRYPISDVRKNSHKKRLTIDRELNQDVDSIRANHVGICRYSVQHFPSNGIIDLTGYIPTPLSRDRYEFWVNGRYVSDPDIVILSPTSFQLRNMRSLRNLEVIELVDDMLDSEIMPRGTTYIDINGQTYGSYATALLYHANIMDESIQYRFNQNTKSSIDEYLPPNDRNANNRDYEMDILSYLKFPTDENAVYRYDELYNLPSINGRTIFHATTKSLGFLELTNYAITSKMDQVWKREVLNGIIPISQRSDLKLVDDTSQKLHVINKDTGYEIYTTGVVDTCFTLYISRSRNQPIDNRRQTIKIMPLLRSGTHVILDDSYEGMWLHSTIPNTEPVQIQ